MPERLNNRTIGKIREAWPENEAIAELAIRCVRLQEALREAEDIGDAAVREVEAERDEWKAKAQSTPVPSEDREAGDGLAVAEVDEDRVGSSEKPQDTTWSKHAAEQVIAAIRSKVGEQKAQPQKAYLDAFDAICDEVHPWLNAAGTEGRR